MPRPSRTHDAVDQLLDEAVPPGDAVAALAVRAEEPVGVQAVQRLLRVALAEQGSEEVVGGDLRVGRLLGRLDERGSQRVHRPALTDGQRPAGPVVEVLAALVVLGIDARTRGARRPIPPAS